MQDIIDQFFRYLQKVWLCRWYMLSAAWTIAIIAWLTTCLLPDEYQAAARVHVDTSTILRPLLRDLVVNLNTDEHIRIVQQTLLNRPNLEKILRAADLDIKLRNDSDYDQAVKRLSKRILFDRVDRNFNLYTISYVHQNPIIAKKVVQAVLDLFVESAVSDTRVDTDSAQRFLDKQIEQYEQRLADAEQKLRDFKRRNIGRMPEEGRDYYQRLREANTALTDAELDLREAENIAKELREQLSGDNPKTGVVHGTRVLSLTAAIDERIKALMDRLDELRLQYTDKHPDVMTVRHMLRDLEQQKKALVEAKASGSSMGEGVDNWVPNQDNPIYQELRIALSEAEANLSSLQIRVEEYRKRAQQLQEMVYILPQIETEFLGLNRDYQINKENYEQLIGKREAARLSQERERTSNDFKFKVIDPPRVPVQPSGPPRILFLTLALIAAVGGGFLVALIMSHVSITFDDAKDLTAALELPVLGSITLSSSPREEYRRRVENTVFLSGSAALFMTYFILLAWQLVKLHLI